MLANSITLSVDVANDGNPSDQVYTRYEEQVNRSTYIGEDHSIEARNLIQFYRTTPTPSGNFRGAAKTEIKFTVDVVVPGRDGNDTIAPAIISVATSFPVGVSDALKKELRQRVLSMMDREDVAGKLHETLEI